MSNPYSTNHPPKVAVASADDVEGSFLSSRALLIAFGVALVLSLILVVSFTMSTIDLTAQANDSMASAAFDMVMDVSSAIYRQPSP